MEQPPTLPRRALASHVQQHRTVTRDHVKQAFELMGEETALLGIIDSVGKLLPNGAITVNIASITSVQVEPSNVLQMLERELVAVREKLTELLIIAD